jgi:transposase
VNVLKSHQKITICTLLENQISQHEICRKTGIDRKTVRRYQREWEAKSPMATGSEVKDCQIPPGWPPGNNGSTSKIPQQASSACGPYRDWIEAQVRLGRNAVSIYQDLVEQQGFQHKYNSVKRFVRRLKAREPERFDVLEFMPGEEAQVDYGQGAPTLHPGTGKHKKPYLFVMTLRYSRKSFRKVVWNTNQQVWAKLHEEAFRYFGGCPQYVVLDNLKEGVIRPDFYEPGLNPVYSAMLAHYGVVADPARVRDPNRKGSVESAIGHTQGTALKGRKFEALEKQNEWLMHWEERWAAPRIHGREKRQVLEMFLEEKPSLKALPAAGFNYFEQGIRTVDDAGVIQVKGCYYAAMPASPGDTVAVRIYDHELEIYSLDGLLLRRHLKLTRKGSYQIRDDERLFNPSRETTRLIERAEKIGMQTAEFCRELFKERGRMGQKVIYGIVNLSRRFKSEQIEQACHLALTKRILSYQAIKRMVERSAQEEVRPMLKQSDELIRPLTEYQTFWEMNSQNNQGEEQNDTVYRGTGTFTQSTQTLRDERNP